jgi:catechol-2,3-dioxygenase
MTHNPLLKEQDALVFSHMGFHVTDLPRMTRYYQEVLGFTQTDHGDLGAVQLVFLSRAPGDHHQLALATGRPNTLSFNPINQLSFKVRDLATLRSIRNHALTTDGTHDMQCATHGNAVSIYFRDPEGNRIEVFLDTPWYCEQPLREVIDLDQSDDAIMARAHAIAQSRPKYQSRATWKAEMAQRMGYVKG